MSHLAHIEIAILVLFILISTAAAAGKTYYDMLELADHSASTQDIKKAYRSLALKYHPDRNNNSEESTEKFREIAEAYETLSDPAARKDYDLSLSRPSSASPHESRRGGPRRRSTTDAHEMFNDLFSNDPFFSAAFKEMDDLFSKTFAEANRRGFKGAPAEKPKKGWLIWFLQDILGLNFQLTTTYTAADCTTSSSNYASSSSMGRRSSMTRSSKTSVDSSGRRIEIREMMKDGNSIKERYVEGKLAARWINGDRTAIVDRPQPGRIGGEGKKKRKSRKKQTKSEF